MAILNHPTTCSIFKDSYKYSFENLSFKIPEHIGKHSFIYASERCYYMQGDLQENKVRMYIAQVVKLIVGSTEHDLPFIIEEVRYFLWFRREFRQWCTLPQKYKFPTNKFPTIAQYIQNPEIAKINWKQIKMLVKANAIKLKQIKRK